MRADGARSTDTGSGCACLGYARGDSPLCPHSPERGGARLCVRDDAHLVESLSRLHRRLGFRKLWAGEKINRRSYGLEWYNQPGREWDSAMLEIEVLEDMLEEQHLRELE